VGRPSGKPVNVFAPLYGTVTGCASQADEDPEELVPIRLDIAKSGCRVKDTFSWNLREASVTPKGFALQLCLDEELPGLMVEPITHAIEEQLAAYQVAPDVGARVVRINLSFQIGTKTVRDSFLWDHAQSDLTPEMFAASMCSDVGLGGPFKAKIAHSIREQLLADRKAVASSEPGVDARGPLPFLFFWRPEHTAN
jgi:SWI/SNF-related matrix-associated actin-dependent regulator of chromatin subfamily B protein 1